MKKKQNRREVLTPDLTPLIDIMFLLLVFFIVSSVFRKDEATLFLNLPKVSKETGKGTQKEKVVTLELDLDKFVVNKKEMDFLEFEAYCKTLTDPKINIDFRVDKNVVYDRIVKVLDVLQKYNLSNLSLITDK